MIVSVSPEIIVLRGDHEVPVGLPHEAEDALLAADGLLVAALVHRECLGDHQGPVHPGVHCPQLLQLLDATRGGQQLHLAQISAVIQLLVIG